jgi:hypothetical protein
MMMTTAVAGAAGTLVILIGTMTVDGVAAADIAGITIETMTIEGAVGTVGTETRGMVAATTVV